MRRDRDEAMNLFDWVPALGMTMDPVLMPLETRLDDDRLFQAVQADMARRRPRTLMDGRPSTPVEVILRMLVVKPWSGWSDEATARWVSARLVWR
jgi:transposase, IS5 family